MERVLVIFEVGRLAAALALIEMKSDCKRRSQKSKQPIQNPILLVMEPQNPIQNPLLLVTEPLTRDNVECRPVILRM
jgi:hypothetical protein